MADGRGNLMIAQGGGPSMVINQSLVGAVLTALDHPRANRVLGARHGIQGVLDEDLVDLRRESRRTLEAVAATPSSALGSVRRKPTAADCAAMFAVLRKRDVRWFFYIGGNDSAETVHIIGEEARRAAFPLGCFHIPKTIDNDLLENDHTPGFGSAARFVACALMGDDLDNRALGGVKIDVVMGRHAGFLTAAAALARTAPDDGPHLIYMPERPFAPDRFVADVQAVLRRIGRCVVAVSEGIADASGTAIATKFTQERDAHGNVHLSGGALGDLLADMVRSQCGIKRVRADTFGYLQRSFPGVASAVDAREARQAGVAAVKAALGGRVASGSVALRRKPGPRYTVRFDIVPLRKVAKNTRQMPPAFIARKGNDVTQAFIAYARPIVGPLPAKALLKGVRA